MITFCREIAELGMIECLRQELLKPQDKLKDETSLRVFFTSEKTRKIPYNWNPVNHERRNKMGELYFPSICYVNVPLHKAPFHFTAAAIS
jgi:cytochrome c oxidase assembly protein Cox11